MGGGFVYVKFSLKMFILSFNISLIFLNLCLFLIFSIHLFSKKNTDNTDNTNITDKDTDNTDNTEDTEDTEHTESTEDTENTDSQQSVSQLAVGKRDGSHRGHRSHRTHRSHRQSWQSISFMVVYTLSLYSQAPLISLNCAIPHCPLSIRPSLMDMSRNTSLNIVSSSLGLHRGEFG